MPIYNFSVGANNRTYQCERFVSGQKETRQMVTVTGIGTREDPAVYGDKLQPRAAMQFNARLIAHGIIKKGETAAVAAGPGV